jgi:hypothetical protein
MMEDAEHNQRANFVAALAYPAEALVEPEDLMGSSLGRSLQKHNGFHSR